MASRALVLVASFATVFAQTPAEVANLVAYWDYGRSPPVYPSPLGTGSGDWAAAYAQAQAIVSQMTNEEKENVTIGYADPANGCSGNSPGVARLGYPGMCLNDAGNGARGVEGTSGYPSGVHVGASWNRDLALARGQYMGAEFKAKGINMALGPVVGPLGRVAEGGRNWEGASNDPYLAGALTYETVLGLQENVIACTKHFIAYEQETNRFPVSLFATGFNQSISSNLDDQTMHELYLWPFQDAVRAGTGAIMCSYNRVNDSYACQNSKTMNGLLKTELGFQGLVVSDWDGQHTGVASAQAGLDLAMPDSPFWSGNLTTAVTNGSLSQSRLDDMATRILATYYKLAPFRNPGFGVPASVEAPHTFVNGRIAASASTIMQGAVEGHVLVKNVKNALPLSNPAFISLFGYDAPAPPVLNPTDPRYGLGYESADIASSAVDNVVLGLSPPPVIAVNGTMWVGGGSGANTPPYVSDPYQAFSVAAQANGAFLAWDFSSALPTVDQASDVCIVFINAFSTEGGDRPALSDDYSDDLVNHVASQCSNTMVVIHNAGIRVIDGFYSNPNVTAIIYAHLPGQDSGAALVQLMYGQQSFSGRLPYTVAMNASDYGSLLAPTVPDATSDYYTQSNFTEGVYIDYRAFIKNNITPRFAFGFGLTYSTFGYSNIVATLPTSSSNLTALPPTAAVVSGGNPNLFDTVATVSVTVTNTGKVAAAEVPQLYVGIPNAPAKQLRGFAKEMLQPGVATTVTFPLTRRDLSIWDVTSQAWRLQSGTYKFHVGKDVMNIALTSSMTLTTT